MTPRHSVFRRDLVRSRMLPAFWCGILIAVPRLARAQDGNTPLQSSSDTATVRQLVSRLDLEHYKATIKGLTQFGDRLQGTDRNRAALDWIGAQLKSYGCSNIERLRYDFPPPPPPAPLAPVGRPPQTSVPLAVGGGRPRGVRLQTAPNNDPDEQ